LWSYFPVPPPLLICFSFLKSASEIKLSAILNNAFCPEGFKLLQISHIFLQISLAEQSEGILNPLPLSLRLEAGDS